MADDSAKDRKWWWFIRDAGISLVTALGLDLLMQEIKKKGAQMAAEQLGKIGEKVFKDQRAELLEDFRILEQKDPKNTANLKRRHCKAIKELKEGRFVTLLCKICPTETEGRRDTLLWLNNMSDKDFDQYLYMLEHDTWLQWLERGWRGLCRICEKAWNDLKSGLNRFRRRARSMGTTAIVKFRQGAQGTWDRIDRLFNWLRPDGSIESWIRLILLCLPVFALIALLLGFATLTFIVVSARRLGLWTYLRGLIGIMLLLLVWLLMEHGHRPSLTIALILTVMLICLFRYSILKIPLWFLFVWLLFAWICSRTDIAQHKIEVGWHRYAKGHDHNSSKGTGVNQAQSPADPKGRVAPKEIPMEEPLSSGRADDEDAITDKTPMLLAPASASPANTAGSAGLPRGPLQVMTSQDQLSVWIDKCRHTVGGKFITCDVFVESEADKAQELAFKEGGAATDNEGNTIPIALGGITSGAGWNVTLQHGIPTKFGLRFRDPSQGSSKQTTIKFHVRWNGNYGDIDTLASIRIS